MDLVHFQYLNFKYYLLFLSEIKDKEVPKNGGHSNDQSDSDDTYIEDDWDVDLDEVDSADKALEIDNDKENIYYTSLAIEVFGLNLECDDIMTYIRVMRNEANRDGKYEYKIPCYRMGSRIKNELLQQESIAQ